MVMMTTMMRMVLGKTQVPSKWLIRQNYQPLSSRHVLNRNKNKVFVLVLVFVALQATDDVLVHYLKKKQERLTLRSAASNYFIQYSYKLRSLIFYWQVHCIIH